MIAERTSPGSRTESSGRLATPRTPGTRETAETPKAAESEGPGRYRASREFELVLFDRLPPAEQSALAELLRDPELYGVLKPRPGTPGTVKVVNRDTALLLLTLAEPGPLPFFVRAGEGAAVERAIADLVLDGVLELEQQGRFVSGAAAARGLIGESSAATGGRLRELSIAAVRYAEALGLDDPEELAARLYAYHRLPSTVAWEALLPGPEETLAFLGGGAGSALGRDLERAFRRADEPETEGWIAWSPRAAGRRSASASSHKLYVSALPEVAGEAFAAVVATLCESGPRPFKVGAAAAGTLRPDKLVVYFGELEELRSMASKLTDRLGGLAAHGVPFSAAIDAAGLLSWGMDPPRAARQFSWHERESWRLWVARRLASALVAARGAGPDGMAPWEFALARLRREGVDVDRWIPSSAIWVDARGE
jgi:hypothetical protein